jgi:F-type H+-transporting ATPase subunit epsilon
MADASLQIEMVSADRKVWSGEGSMVIARTTEGDLGILANHAPMLAVLVEGVVEVRTGGGDDVTAVVNGGFLSVANNRVSILSENAELSSEIDVEAARRDLEAATGRGDSDEADESLRRHAEARLRAAERS